VLDTQVPDFYSNSRDRDRPTSLRSSQMGGYWSMDGRWIWLWALSSGPPCIGAKFTYKERDCRRDETEKGTGLIDKRLFGDSQEVLSYFEDGGIVQN
jgi:hypothetical protein